MKIVRICISILVCTALVSAAALMQGVSTTDLEPSAQMSGVPFVYQLACDSGAQGIVGDVGTRATVHCPANCAPGSVWGTDTYTRDSNVCSAARHAGVITQAGGTFTVHLLGEEEAFTGSAQNGITTFDYASYPASYTVFAEELPALRATCDTRGWDLPGEIGTEWNVICPEDCTDGTIWGTGTYSNDSYVCVAAQHAGLIGAEGGGFSLVHTQGQPLYESSTQNDITSAQYGEWPGSFYLADAPPPAISLDAFSTAAGMLPGEPGSVFLVKCPADFELGTVWGSETYTDDSAICTAALHAGVIGTDGGRFTVIISMGQQTYKASIRNGVTTNDYGPWPRSYLVEDAALGEQAFYDVMAAEATETPE